MYVQLVAGLFALIAVAATVALVLQYRKDRAFRARYSPVTNIDEAVDRARAELERTTKDAAAVEAESKRKRADLDQEYLTAKADYERRSQESVAEFGRQRDALTQDYAKAKAVYERLRVELALLEENREDISFGVYKPHYDFDSSERYRQELDAIRASQKELLRSDRAATCKVAWEVGGSKREGAKMQRQYLKLMLRAFNGECDAAVAKVTWNNVTKMEERIGKACEAINDLGSTMQMSISEDYRLLKVKELRLEFETEEKKHAEAEEQRRIKEQMREEEKAVREAERAKKEAEEEEARYAQALEKARAELAKAKGAALEELNSRIQQLDQALHKAHELKDKATSMAQLTRSGHVYVISNLGSFGDNVFKIGMTRRLDPMDRVHELGDASVPFEFDVHAMVYSEDAPSLEGAFHSWLEQRRLNMVNPRKEFFSVSLGELQEFVRTRNLNIELTQLAEAKEYRQSLAIRVAAAAAAKQAPAAPEAQAFPAAI
jgi:hypothetical protein